MQELNEIPHLLKLLQTKHANKADSRIISISKSKEAIEYIRNFVRDSDTSNELKKLALAHIGRMLAIHSSCYPLGFSEEYFISVLRDSLITFQVKQILYFQMSHFAKQSKSFMKRLAWFARQLLEKATSNFIEPQQAKEQSEIQPLINHFALFSLEVSACKQTFVSACQAFILIGDVVMQLINDTCVDRESQVQSKPSKTKDTYEKYYHKDILSFFTYLRDFLKLISTEDRLIQHLSLFQQFFRMLQQIVDSTHTPSIYIKNLAKWEYLPSLLHTIYSLDIPKNQIAYVSQQSLRDRTYSKLKETASLCNNTLNSVHFELILSLIKLKCRKLAQSMYIQYIQPIKETIKMYNHSLPNKFIEHLAQLLHSHYIIILDNPISEMIKDFETILLPLITKILVFDRFQIFAQSPAKMYAKLFQIIESQAGQFDILGTLAHIVYMFADNSQDFFLYLFQIFRYSLERQLGCDSKQQWQPPDYLLNSQPIDLCAVFYLMSIVPYNKDLSSHVFSFLKAIITPSFVQQLKQMEIALFYFFLEGSWLQLYDNNDEGLFLLDHILTQSLNKSSKYFLYQFLLTLSDYYINKEFILNYVRNLPILQQFENKWQNVLKWTAYLNDMDESFSVQLVTILRGHIKDQITQMAQHNEQKQGDANSLKQYLKILVRISKDKKMLNGKVILQELLIGICSSIAEVHAEVINYLYCIVSNIIPFFQIHQPIFLQILPHLLNIQQTNKLQACPLFYYILAEYIIHTKNKPILVQIWKYADALCNSVGLILQAKSPLQSTILYNVSNVLIPLQNLILKHLAILGEEILHQLVAKCMAVRETIRQNIMKIQSFQGWSVLARCLNLQLALFAGLGHNNASYEIYLIYAQKNAFRDYDAKLLITLLEKVNPHTSPANRTVILNIVMCLLEMAVKESKQSNKETQSYKRLFVMPSIMTPVIDIAESMFKAVKRFMIFYEFPKWTNFDKLTQNLGPQFCIRFRKQFEECARQGRAKSKDTTAESTGHFLADEHQENVALLKKRKKWGQDEVVNEKDDSSDGSEKLPEHKTIYESFTKKIKRDANLHTQAKLSSSKEKNKNQHTLATSPLEHKPSNSDHTPQEQTPSQVDSKEEKEIKEQQ